MKNKFLWVLMSFSCMLYAQEKEEAPAIESQQVTVVKTFNPEVIKVFKQRPNPKTYDSLAQKQKTVTYTFEDFPVVSTFTPNKATPLKLQRKEVGPLYNALAALGVGGSGQSYLNAAASVVLDRVQSFGLELLHDQTSRNVSTAQLPTSRGFTSGLLTHNYTLRDSRWDTRLKFQTTRNNYYGVMETPNVLSDGLSNLDPSFNRSYFQLQSHWKNYSGILNEIPLQINIYGDSFDTRETYLVFTPRLRADMGSSFLDLQFKFEGSRLAVPQSFLRTTPEEFSHGISQGTLAWTRLGRKFKWKIGARAAHYFTDQENYGDIALGIYPVFQMEYKPQKGSLRPFINVSGGERLYTLREQTLVNPFLAPSVNLLPEIQNFKAQLGFHSAIGKKIDFMWKAQYEQYDQKGFFKRLPFQQGSNLNAYEYSNAFQIVYDAFNQLSFHSSLQYSFGKDNSVQLEGVYRNADPDRLANAWNIPEIEASAKAFIRLFRKAQVQVKYSFLGKRPAASFPYFNNLNPANAPVNTVNLAAYSQLQTQLLYQLHQRWEIFVRLQINSGDPNACWLGFPQFEQLFLAGVQYRFNLNL